MGTSQGSRHLSGSLRVRLNASWTGSGKVQRWDGLKMQRNTRERILLSRSQPPPGGGSWDAYAYRAVLGMGWSREPALIAKGADPETILRTMHACIKASQSHYGKQREANPSGQGCRFCVLRSSHDRLLLNARFTGTPDAVPRVVCITAVRLAGESVLGCAPHKIET